MFKFLLVAALHTLAFQERVCPYYDRRPSIHIGYLWVMPSWGFGYTVLRHNHIIWQGKLEEDGVHGVPGLILSWQFDKDPEFSIYPCG